MEQPEIETFCPSSREEWRQWLVKNHISSQSVWLVLYKVKSKMPTVSWIDAVEEALCFGWVDSRRKPLDQDRFIQFYCKRKAKSTWSRINKEKVVLLIDQGLMQPAGLASIETAKQNGSWNILDDVESHKIPEDLEKAFLANKGLEEFYLSQSKSLRKAMLHRLAFAKQPQTRLKRINEIVELAAQKLKPK